MLLYASLQMVSFRVKVWVTYYKARKGTELRFRLRLFFFFGLGGGGGSRCFAHASPRVRNISLSLGTNVEMLLSTCSCMLSQQISTIVFSNAVVEGLLIKLGDSA